MLREAVTKFLYIIHIKFHVLKVFKNVLDPIILKQCYK
jgi:hypothetical protein